MDKVRPNAAKIASRPAADRPIRWKEEAQSGGGLGMFVKKSFRFEYPGFTDARVDVENLVGHNLRYSRSFLTMDFRALVDQVCRLKPGVDSREALILDLFLEKRRFQRNPETLPGWTDDFLRGEMGANAANESLSDDDFDYLVERLIDCLDKTPRPAAWIVALLEKSRDERALEPAIRLLGCSLTADDANMESCANDALNILVPFQDRPEVLDTIEEASRRGEGDIRGQALHILEIRKRRLSDDHADAQYSGDEV